jgi:diguanylate cyclase (GGDEF)-like protein/PAS domain S-box-containing protein
MVYADHRVQIYIMKDEEKTKEHLLEELREMRARLSMIETEDAALRESEESLRESKERYKKMVDAVTAYTYTVEIAGGKAVSTWHSRECVSITGYNPEDYVSNPFLWYSMIHPEDREAVEGAITKILKGGEIPPLEHRIIGRDGLTVWIRNTMIPYYDEMGTLIRYDGLIENISDRKLSEQILRESEEKFRSIAYTAADAIILSDSKGRIIFWNPSAQRIFGYTEEEIAGKPLQILMPEQYHDAHQQGLERVKASGESRYVGKTHEMQGLRKDGLVFPVELSVSMWKVRDQTFYSGIIRDITRRKNLEDELERLATIDKLTQVFNRTKFYEVMNIEQERAVRYEHPLSLIMFDIDHFKRVNDNYGHAAGDYVLKTLTLIVKEKLREIDYLFRWGGEEFVVIAPETDLENAAVLAERIRKTIAEYQFDKVGRITVSLGVVKFSQGDTEDIMIKRADDALYRAKEKGRNRVEVGIV